MRLVCILCVLLPWASASWAEERTAAELAASLTTIAVDPAQTYRVRDLEFTRGDIKIYLNEGVLSFAAPLAGHTFAAVFTTQGSEAGDAEILLLPPVRSERASLASFTNSPNLDEHFNSAVFFFSDNTAEEFHSDIDQAPVRTSSISPVQEQTLDNVFRNASSPIRLRLIQALLDNHKPEQGFFYALVAGRNLGGFEVSYDPREPEPINVGRPLNEAAAGMRQLWTSFRPRRAPKYVEPSPRLSDYRIDTTIRPDLSMASDASFTYMADASDGRTAAFGLSERLRVNSATVDDKPVEVFQPERGDQEQAFLLISSAPLQPAGRHRIQVRYEGTVIRPTESGGYFVADRNAWYPYVSPMLTNFDLTFRFAPQLTLVSSGEPVTDQVADGVRIVHRRTPLPEGLAGFNLGRYKSSSEEHGSYLVEAYAEKKSAESLQVVAEKAQHALDYYTKQWTALPIHTLAVTPIAGTFGQGFPGLIYLSTVAYMRPEDRPPQLRNPITDTFFSDIMLPHEVAHQWWGNIVIPAGYRTGWLVEAMANYSALQLLEKTQSAQVFDAVLATYRADLISEPNGKPIDSFGPVDFGIRLLDAHGLAVWHDIIYEKGTWILHMLRQRLGEEGFRRMQLRLLAEFLDKPIGNEEFRQVASEFVPQDQPDKDLSLFFDTWVYGTGIPRLSLGKTAEGPAILVSGVDEDFTADMPVHCHGRAGREELRWIRISSGSNPMNQRGGAGACELPSDSEFLYSRPPRP